MQLINIKIPGERVSFRQAVLQGLGRDQGLYFPERFDILPDVSAVLEKGWVPRSAQILHHLIGDEISQPRLEQMVASAFNFPLKTTDNPGYRSLFCIPRVRLRPCRKNYSVRWAKTSTRLPWILTSMHASTW